MAADSRGPRNQPIFSGSGASADAEDLTLLGLLAVTLGTRRVGTRDDMNALTDADLFDGLQFHNLTDGYTYTYSGGWKRQAVHKGGGFFDVVAADGTTQVSHGLGVVPTDVQLTRQSHPSNDQISRYFQPVLFGTPSATRFNVRLLDARTNGWADGQQQVRFSWHAYAAM